MLTAQVMAGAPVGGAEVFFERLCAALHRAGEPVLPVIRRDAARVGRLEAAGLAPVQARFGGALDVLTGPMLGRLLRARAPAVVVAWMGRAAAMTPQGRWTLVGRLGGYYDLRRFRRCAHLVGNTRHIVEWMVAQGVPAGRAHYLPNFVPDLLGVAPAARAALGVPDRAPLVLGLGRLHVVKGFDVLIRALAALPEVHAVIAGEGEERGALTRLADACGVGGRVHLPGWRGDGGALLAACDVLVCPSRHEPLGNVVLEGWSAGRPVVAAASVGPAALIRDGEDGVLTPVDDWRAMAAGIARCLEDGAAGLGAAGRARYAVEFGEAAVVGRWREFLHAVAP
jgi:glycosyltransferase involved in cell wall biosynthesis